jgi:hypothetical protein
MICTDEPVDTRVSSSGGGGGKLPSQNTQPPPPKKKKRKEGERERKGVREGGRERGTYIFWCCDTSDQ